MSLFYRCKCNGKNPSIFQDYAKYKYCVFIKIMHVTRLIKGYLKTKRSVHTSQEHNQWFKEAKY